MFGPIIVMQMFREQRILTQMCGNNLMVLKAPPPLIISVEQIEHFVSAIGEVTKPIIPRNSGRKVRVWCGER